MERRQFLKGTLGAASLVTLAGCAFGDRRRGIRYVRRSAVVSDRPPIGSRGEPRERAVRARGVRALRWDPVPDLRAL